MTRVFDNIKDILKHKCILCNSKIIHEIFFASPDYEAIYPEFKKNKYYLKFDAHNLKVEVTVDSITNRVTFNCNDDTFIVPPNWLNNQLFLYLNSRCKNCTNYNFSSSDIDIYLDTKTISPIFIERENIIIKDYYIEYHHLLDELNSFMKIYQIIDISNSNNILDNPVKKICKMKPIDFDFSDIDNVYNKIKTISIFK